MINIVICNLVRWNQSTDSYVQKNSSNFISFINLKISYSIDAIYFSNPPIFRKNIFNVGIFYFFNRN